MSTDNKSSSSATIAIIVAIIVVAVLGFGIWLISRQNEANEQREKDPEKILGRTIGEVSGKYCSMVKKYYNEFHVSDRVFNCGDIEDKFMESDLNNYILSSYSYSSYSGYGSFYFDIDNTQTDLRPLKIENPEQFVGQMATALCPKYSLADFKIYASGEHIGISTVSCRDINENNMEQDVIITDAYYEADEESGDNPDEYFEQNNAKGTRKLYFDGEYMQDRILR